MCTIIAPPSSILEGRQDSIAFTSLALVTTDDALPVEEIGIRRSVKILSC